MKNKAQNVDLSARKLSHQVGGMCRSCAQALWEELPLVVSAPWRLRA